MTVRVSEEVWLSSKNLTLLEKFDVERRMKLWTLLK